MRFLSLFLTLVIVGWAAGLALFVHAMPKQQTSAQVTTDAIVVLTGGNARVERGFTMLAEGAAPLLIISGVGTEVTLNEMLLAHASRDTRESIAQRGASIVLDHVARTTETNAREVASIVQKRELRTIRLITAHYHMPRSKMELQAAMPEVRIIPDAVFPEGFQREEWWKHENSRALVLSEFHKLLAVKLRPVLQHVA